MSRKKVDPRYAPAAFQHADAAHYCGVSTDFFDDHIRPSVPPRYLGSLRLWLRDDLEDFLSRLKGGSERMGSQQKSRGAAVTAPGVAHGGVAP